MQQRELAISLMEHPMIRFLYESKVFHPSVINEVIVQEILREEEAEPAEEGESFLSKVLATGQTLAGFAQKACEVISSILNWLSLGVLGLGALLIPATFGGSMPVAMAAAYSIDMVSTTFDFTAAVFALLAGNFASAFSNFLQGVVGVVMSTFTAGSGGSLSKKASKEAIKAVYKKAAKEVAKGGAETAVKIAGNEIAKNKADRLVKGLLKNIKSDAPEESPEEAVEVQPDVASLNGEITQEMEAATTAAKENMQAEAESGKAILNQEQQEEIIAETTQFKIEHQAKVKKRMGQIETAQQEANEGEDITDEFSNVGTLRDQEERNIKEKTSDLGIQIPVPDFNIEEIVEKAAIPNFIKKLLSDDEEDTQVSNVEQQWEQFINSLSDPQQSQYAWYGQYIGETAKNAIINSEEGERVSDILETYIQQINNINFEIPQGVPERLNLLLQTYLLAQREAPEPIKEQTEEQPFISDEVYGKLPIDPNQVQELKNWVNSNQDTVKAMLQQQVPQEEGEAAPQKDFQQETIPAREVSASWKEYMDSFFGMRSQMTSFMNQYLLRDQAKMLNELLNILSQIKSGSTSPEEMLSLSRIHDTIQEKIDAQAILDSEDIEDYGAEARLVVSDPVKKNMRQHLESMVALLKDVREDVRNYEEYATKTSADPRYDGSSLKRKMDRSLSAVQTVIADLIKDIQVAIQDRRNIDDDEANIVAQDASRRQPQGEEEEVVQEVFRMLEGIELTEEDGSERQQKIQHVEEVYNELRRMYQGSLLPSLEGNKLKEAQTIGSQMLEYLIKDKKFLSYFPRTVVSGNKVMTLKQASSSLAEVIRTFVNVIRDMVPITKTQEVSKSTLEQASLRLKVISDAIESMFGVASEYNEEFMKKIVQDFAEQEENQSLTDTPSFNREEIEPLLKRLADFIKEQGLLNENLGKLVGDMGIENKKSFGRKVGKIFTKEEFEKINSYFENEQNRKSFISEYFKNEDSFEDSSELDADEEVSPEEEYDHETYDAYHLGDRAIGEIFTLMDLKHFGGREEIRDFWRWAGQQLGKINVKELEQLKEAWHNKKYGKFHTTSRAVSTFFNPSLPSTSSLDSDDRENVRRHLESFLQFTLLGLMKNELDDESINSNFEDGDFSFKDEGVTERFAKVVKAYGDELDHNARADLSLRKQVEPFMRFIMKLEKTNKDWFRSTELREIREAFKRIIEYNGLLDYIKNQPSSTKSSDESAIKQESLEKTLKPIIEKMLKEHYNY